MGHRKIPHVHLAIPGGCACGAHRRPVRVPLVTSEDPEKLTCGQCRYVAGRIAGVAPKRANHSGRRRPEAMETPMRAGSIAARIYDAAVDMLAAGLDVTTRGLSRRLGESSPCVSNRLRHLHDRGIVVIESRRMPPCNKISMVVTAVRPVRNRGGEMVAVPPTPNAATPASLRVLTAMVWRIGRGAQVTTFDLYGALRDRGWERARIRATLRAAVERGILVGVARPIVDGIQCDAMRLRVAVRDDARRPCRTPGWHRADAYLRPTDKWVLPTKPDATGDRLTQIEVAKIVERLKAEIAPPPEPEPVPDIIVTEMRRTVTVMPTGGRQAMPELARGTAPVRSVDLGELDVALLAELRDLFGSAQNNP